MPRKRLRPEAAALLRTELARRWPGGEIPFPEGGRFFRELCDRLDGVEEWQLSDLARKWGYWKQKAYEGPVGR